MGQVSPLDDGIALDELGDDVVGVRVLEVGRRDGRDPLLRAVGLRQGIGRQDDPRLGHGLALEDEVTGGIVLDGRDGRRTDRRDRHRCASGVEEISTRRAASIGHESKSLDAPEGGVAVVEQSVIGATGSLAAAMDVPAQRGRSVFARSSRYSTAQSVNRSVACPSGSISRSRRM